MEHSSKTSVGGETTLIRRFQLKSALPKFNNQTSKVISF